MPSNQLLHVYVIAGEASGDVLGAGLMQSLKVQLGEGVRFYGVGGERMAEQGLASLFPYHELSLMGFAEIVPHLFSLTARIASVVEDIQVKKPDVVITIDSPGFTTRVVKKLHESGMIGVKFIHYVAPTVWAYKPKRAKKFAKLFDHLLVLLPFEPPYFEREGLATTFVGHPVAYQSRGDGAAFRAANNIAADERVIAMLPGSRENEIRRHMPMFAQALMLLSQQHPKLSIVVPIAPRLVPLVAPYFEGCPFRALLVGESSQKLNALAACDAGLVKSGTVALEVARAGVPHVVAYRTHPISAWIVRRMLTTRFANLINILLNREVIPEFIQEHCEPQALAAALSELLENPERAEAQRAGSAQALSMLQPEGGQHPNDAAAQVVMQVCT